GRVRRGRNAPPGRDGEGRAAVRIAHSTVDPGCCLVSRGRRADRRVVSTGDAGGPWIGSMSDRRHPHEVVDLLSALIRFDTTNAGPGDARGERECADWLVDRLTAVGWGPVVTARPEAPDRSNVVVRVPGADPELPALLVHGHLDVVPAEPDQWTRDPFGGEVADGYVWGRGAVDMKDACAAMLGTLLEWGRTGQR